MNWPTVAVELALCAGVLGLLLADALLGPAKKQAIWKLALAGILVLGGVLWWQRPWIGQSFQPMAAGQAMFVLDAFAWIFKWLLLLTMLIVILMTRVFTPSLDAVSAERRSGRSRTSQSRESGGHSDADRGTGFTRQSRANVGEFYLLLYSALLGMLVLASAHDLLLLFIGLELLTFSLYVMAAYLKTDARSIEAGLKYLILGSVSSGFLVYGISLLYGTVGATDFATLRDAFATGQMPLIAKAGMLLVLAGLGFKVAAVPFHLWVPDVYEGAPSPVVALLSVGSKMAGTVVLLRLLYSVFWPAQTMWSGILAAVAAATMFYGNLAAIPQTNIKRLLGYSSIGHAGYLLMGLSTASWSGAQAVGYYLLAYLLGNLAAFFVVVAASHAVGSDRLEDYDGLSRRSPLLAATLFVGLLSLAGVPPLAGFVGKLLVLLATVESGRLWLVAIGAVNVAISLYYYLQVVRRMYLRPPTSTQPLVVDPLTRAALLALIGGILLVGVVQDPFLRAFSTAIRF